MPRMLTAAVERDLSVELFGRRFATPLLLAPVGVIGLCAEDGHGDLACARAAATTGVPMVVGAHARYTERGVQEIQGLHGEAAIIARHASSASARTEKRQAGQRMSHRNSSARGRLVGRSEVAR